MKKVILMVFIGLIFGCAPLTVEQSIQKLTYQKDAMSGADIWVVWRIPTVQFMDNLLEEYEINSYMKCVKLGDNYSVAMTTQSGAEPILQKYEFLKQGSDPLYVPLGKNQARKASLYRGDEGHLDIYETEFSPEDIKTLIQVVDTPGIRVRPVSVDGDAFASKKLSDTEKTQIKAILKVCRFM